eukprot:CAMPEP_0206504070 /NCGR_PEP_ID=MMETSP0324_2-20121206/55205_1 /ASSEMBLY_ACC=CAM_ASM_000836 /TAXON_ID=2866 /ORGANISM="Crypthecodinium cohnii, Strain Seligo" /LENGTH=314 /DNA_ID=CAMNT_0053993047 /DNA_START=140 /DNA_END=1084 /DNA_ORIENTATION=-
MAAHRVLSQIFDMARNLVTFDFGGSEIFEKAEEHVSYPGVRTVYRTELVCGHLDETNEEGVPFVPDSGIGEFIFKDEEGEARKYCWLSEADCSASGINLGVARGNQEFSSLVQAPVAMGDDSLRKILECSGVELSGFALERLSLELVKGESRLRQVTDGGVMRVVNLVLLKLIKTETTEVLVDCSETLPDGVIVQHAYLPGGKQRPDENHFIAAQRILTTKLGFDENCVTLHNTGVHVFEESADSPSYPGLRTLYRKKVISGTVTPPLADDDMSTVVSGATSAWMQPNVTRNHSSQISQARTPTSKKCVRWSGA